MGGLRGLNFSGGVPIKKMQANRVQENIVAVVDVARKSLVLKIVYYGCALGGKTTNLVTLHRLTDPDGQQGLVSIATKDDRTLFFDLLPMNLGKIGGLNVRVKVYTVPGQVHYELTRRQVLAGADGVVLVFDSSPEVREPNAWAVENLGFNLKKNGFDPKELPTVYQYNKRDLPEARPVIDMAGELNPTGVTAFEAVATEGAGVVDTFAEVVSRAIVYAYKNAGKHEAASEVAVSAKVKEALAEAAARQPALPGAPEAEEGEAEAGGQEASDVVGDVAASLTFEHRVDMEEYRDEWAERGRDRRIMDQESLLSEAVQTGMELAERLEGYNQVQALSERRSRMMEALGKIAPMLADPGGAPIPEALLPAQMEACERSRGSILLFTPGKKDMEERQVQGHENDPLNLVEAAGVGTPAFRLCQTRSPRLIEDLDTEVYFDARPPQAQGVSAALILPLACDGLSFGAVVVYVAGKEPPFDVAEREFWSTTSTLLSLSLHWRALRRKVAAAKQAS